MKQRTTLLFGSAVAVAVLAVTLFGDVLAERPSAGATAVRSPHAFTESAFSGIAHVGTDAAVSRLEAARAVTPRDAGVLASLGLAYQLRWRQTGDAAYLSRSEAALRSAIASRPDDPTALLGLGNLALIRHRFQQALVLGRRAQRLTPHASHAYGVIGDAQIELGRYRQAFATFERMVALKPSLASYSRIGYARELSGDPAGAIAAMGLALDAAGGQPEPTAWTHVELGKLELGLGRLARAERHFRAALAAVPGFVYAYELLARVAAAHGALDRAISHARRAADSIPLPQLVGLLADLLERKGIVGEARRQRATIAAIDKILVANGVSVDLESAVYRADHRIHPAETVALARRARAVRPSIYGDDALGWALARAGRCDEAVTWSKRSLRLGTKDPLLWFHHGFAAGCAGDAQVMHTAYRRALALNPHFSVRWSPVAKRAIA